MKFAYADPPYFGLAEKFYGDRHESASDFDDLDTHKSLIERLCTEFSDGWAMSLHSPSLKHILPLCPDDVRVMAWVKPFASFKKNVTVAYAWEPVIVRGGRKRPTTMPTVRDWVAECITLERGFPGAKPERFCFWLFDVLGMQADDEFVDLFPGSGAVGRAWAAWRRQNKLPFEKPPVETQPELFGDLTCPG